MFPIDIMPAGIQAVLKWAPFYYELFCPVAIFLGRLKGAELWQALAIQTGWVFLTWFIARTMWHRGLRHYQAVGGCLLSAEPDSPSHFLPIHPTFHDLLPFRSDV